MIPWLLPDKPQFFLITNIGTYLGSVTAQHYPYQLFLPDHFHTRHRASMLGAIGRARARGGVCHILDNGAYEGQEINQHSYFNLIKAVKPDIAVLPDFPNEPWDRTYSNAVSFMAKAKDEPDFPQHTRWMFCGQGRNQKDTLACYVCAMMNFDPKEVVMGVGVGYHHWCLRTNDRRSECARINMIYDLMDCCAYWPQFRWHVLGARYLDTPIKWPKRFYDRMLGVDTYKPCSSALEGCVYPIPRMTRIEHIDVREPFSEQVLTQSIRAFRNIYDLDATHELA